MMVDSVSECCNLPTEFHARDLINQRVQIAIRMGTDWVCRWHNVLHAASAHLSIFATVPFEISPSILFWACLSTSRWAGNTRDAEDLADLSRRDYCSVPRTCGVHDWAVQPNNLRGCHSSHTCMGIQGLLVPWPIFQARRFHSFHIQASL